MFPGWLHALSIAALLLGGACAVGIAVDVVRRAQQMAVMNIVWPVVALFGSVLVVGAYVRYGRDSSRQAIAEARAAGRDPPARGQPFPAAVGKGTLHCGAGCMLGDLAAEWLAFACPGLLAWLGWPGLFVQKTFAVWVLDFLFAFCIGIVFQYFAIAPMRQLSVGAGLVAALKADTLSLAAWQVGMYGLMALVQFGWFAHAFGGPAEVDTPEFWFAMQLAMMAGFLTAYPVNWWLIRRGIKERM